MISEQLKEQIADIIGHALLNAVDIGAAPVGVSTHTRYDIIRKQAIDGIEDIIAKAIQEGTKLI